ncbi:biotin-dependent carboxyltransferase [Parvularcula sp. ZS-1/3]|uniref:Biotin-dependent carboxyltransferase n=1 Tax=Parvularcula mediterranea TaxID=2732508 RepID=A0A7Y3RIN1_9PROT|nr:biotin-dependent carboxyltransferase family protein [Parvularcula mediterranea]NNU14763.1 biotin-dependent carboxyltransferase [Parvularcula mediterranea]
MSLRVLKPGPQSILQAYPRIGFRHVGVPWSGPADQLSATLANHLCGNGFGNPVLEIPMGGAAFEAQQDVALAVTGGQAELAVDGQPAGLGQALLLKKNSKLSIGSVSAGFRVYLAVAGGFEAAEVMASASTYLPASLGGFAGRALREGDVLEVGSNQSTTRDLPSDLLPRFAQSHIIRVTRSPEFSALPRAAQRGLFSKPFTASRQLSRMGVPLEAEALALDRSEIASAPVHPGTVQLPPSGLPIILGPDAQTTGGYPRVLSVIAADMHRLGQIGPGHRVQFFERTEEEAEADFRGLCARYAGVLTPRELSPTPAR